ncbi:MAG: YicC family protein [Deltaproteobacteria bacterium]|jgi:uncharacterized protein (TIGR00255 family)|nr:YicC family protein [Deltaproteobacteria bacterium]
MLRSMTGFGRYYIEDAEFTQTWEIRSVNSRYLDLRWHLPQTARSLEAPFEKIVRRHTTRGRVEISLNLQFSSQAESGGFNRAKAETMLKAIKDLARREGVDWQPDYSPLLGVAHLWDEHDLDPEMELDAALSHGLELALRDWNESRAAEARSLEQDLASRILRMEEWSKNIEEYAPALKAERITLLRERLAQILAEQGLDMDESRLAQEVVILADRLDVSEEIIRLRTHLERLRELLESGQDAGRRLDFTLQECFREINTCGNKIQDAQISRLVVDFKNELEKCREQAQNIE